MLFQQKKHCFILSIDGAAYGSLLPTLVLEKMQEELRRYGSSMQLYECFDIICAAGSGAISAAQLLFSEEQSWVRNVHAAELSSSIEAYLDCLYDEEEQSYFTEFYPVQGKEEKHEELAHLLRLRFGESILIGSSKKPIIFPVLDLKREEVSILSSEVHYAVSLFDLLLLVNQYSPFKNQNSYHLEEMLHVRPSNLVNFCSFGKNPVLYALQWAKENIPLQKEIHILSLGTARYPQATNGNEIMNNVRFQEASIQAAIQLVPNVHYYRITTTWNNGKVFQQTELKKAMYKLGNMLTYNSMDIIRKYTSLVLSHR